MSTFPSKLKSSVLPAAAGLLCAHWFPWPPPTSVPVQAGQERLVFHSPPSVPKAELKTTPADKAESSDRDEAPKPGSTLELLTLLADNRRVEDLLLEVEKMPPGKDRNSGIWRLMKEWLPLDRSAAMEWMEHLTDSKEKESAVSGMVESWCREDSHAASAYIAALPEGPIKRSAGKQLGNSLILRDPASGLRWSLASREEGENVGDDIHYKVLALAGGDYQTAFQLVNDSSLSPEEKEQMQETARKEWNSQKVQNGEWDQLIPGKGGAP